MGDFGNWGWNLDQRRALVFPDGRDVAVAPPGRAAFRYHGGAKRAQVSVDAGPYVDLVPPMPPPENVVNVYDKDDFPACVGTFITLDPTKIYVVQDAIDLGDCTIDVNGSTIEGISPVFSKLITDSPNPLLICTMGSTTRSVTLQNTSGLCFDLSGMQNNLIQCRVDGSPGFVGHVGNCQLFNMVGLLGANLNGGIQFDGAMLSFNVAQVQLQAAVGAAAFKAFEFTSNFNAQACRLIASNVFTANVADEAIVVDPAAVFGTDGPAPIELNAFLGPGTPLVGTTPKDPRLEFRQNTNIGDSTTSGSMSLTGNTTATVITVIGTPVNVGAGATAPPHIPFTLDPDSSRFSLVGAFPNQQLQYDGLSSEPFVVHFSATVERVGGGTPIARLLICKNGAPVTSSQPTTELAPTAARVGSSVLLMLDPGDVLDMQVANDSSTNDMIVQSAVMTVSRSS